ncbi:GAF domain-containing protein [Dyadobacter aurulentus]|uniref:GAF domain-containing protein n=1 Tax=Dyadobacter sp. UC 10 TaxID=2605428 RepID=UPI0011F1E6ED|nr:GAF domain-containing protein [Dyadobacter sp. UC 10]KAA0993056.1 GAF domain-containing protein [Dyadobacter sp. UC 10]
MKPLKLLIVAMKEEWLNLLEDSLRYEGYNFHIKQVNSKQAAIKAFRESKYDLLISNHALPDGAINDLATVLGSQLPCMVMSEGQCPVTSEKVLAIKDSNYYINCYNKLDWIPALENTIEKWQSNARQDLDDHIKNHDTLYKKSLNRCIELLSGGNQQKDADALTAEAFEMLLEVMSVSRIYLCAALHSPDKTFAIRQTVEVSAAGVPAKVLFTENPLEIPFFDRWTKLFEKGQTVFERLDHFPVNDHQWLSRHGIQSLMAVPIGKGSKWLGYIAVEDNLNIRAWTEAEKELIAAVAKLIPQHYFLTSKPSRIETELFASPV